MNVRFMKKINIGLGFLIAMTALAVAEGTVSEQWAKSLAAETMGDYKAALAIHQQILPELEKTYMANLRAGWLFYLNADYSTASGYYEKAASQSSGALSPLYGILNCCVAQKDLNKAAKVAKAILVIDGNNYTANMQLAVLLYQERNFSRAAGFYRKLYSLYPEDLSAASGLAWSYLEQGNTREALPLFKNILMVSPDYAYAQQGLTTCNQISNR